MKLAFWLAIGALAYTFAGYPALMMLLARLRPRVIRRGATEPGVTVLIAAHNEAATIGTRIENCLALEYPHAKLEVVVASDGSTDETVAIARRYERRGASGPAVRVLAYPSRRGKPSVLNDSIPRCAGDIVLLGDARQRYDEDAVRRLVENFADPSVGAASGELHLVNGAGRAVGDGVGAYWRYEKAIRRAESAVHSTVGATGAIYAIRRPLFEPIPPDTLTDDVIIPLRIVRRGYRVVFDGRARAWDRVAESTRAEYVRKLRTIAGVVQLFLRERWIWRPDHPVWMQALSHKLLRLTAPFFMMAALAASAGLAPGRPFYRAAFAAQLVFYAAAAGGALARDRSGPLARLLAIPYAFCLLNLTTLVSLWQYARGRHNVRWQKATEAARSEAA
jgi:cellulose synthase/poly-beta-1,6-N-acetylglucosamine synthase-like glycosyltransferase